MELSSEHIASLKLIYKNGDKGIDKSEFINKDGKRLVDPIQLIFDLEKFDLIETDDNLQFFLTLEGYDLIENGFENEESELILDEEPAFELIDKLAEEFGSKK
ncbi:MAG: hypothetical protein CMO01_02905 [Thalassobius sp.]|nr:hypothetical protein [Thalassovita sp.]|tara:strand:- start:193 stop:501 length:309 start_codon:yes stop_codon:yes gene_type:complete